MVRDGRRRAAILDADVVDPSRLAAKDENGWAARLAQHRVERLEPALARYGGRLVRLTSAGARAEFPSAAEALGAAIEFQQAMADANRGQPKDAAVVFRLGLHLGEAGHDEEQAREQAPAGGIAVSSTLRDAVAGRVPASFAELGSAGLGTVERPIRTYEVGWDPADWPAASAAAARPIAARDDGTWRDGKPIGRWAIALAGGLLAAVVVYLAAAPRPQPASAGLAVSGAENLERLLAWQGYASNFGEPDEPDDGHPTSDDAQPVAYDGVYTGMATMRADGRPATFTVKVTNGVGSGRVSRLDCGTAAISLKISPAGDVSGMALMFGSTCLKTELAVRGRASGGTLQLRLGSQYLEMSKSND